MTRTTPRRARRRWRCERCHDIIPPGTPYLEHVVSPDHDDLGNTTWWRSRECASCAITLGRGPLLQP